MWSRKLGLITSSAPFINHEQEGAWQQGSWLQPSRPLARIAISLHPVVNEERSVNAADAVNSVVLVQALASTVTLVKQRFPAARANLRPWRDDPQTRDWLEEETLDLSFHFPGWSPRLECRSLLLQLRLKSAAIAHPQTSPELLGVLMRGMTFDGERWRLATMGDWQPEGSHLPRQEQVHQLREICRELFILFEDSAASDTAA